MQEVIQFLDVHNASLMVIITLVYVLATILICIFNGKSAKATQDQIKESRQQYEETKRLQMMPVLQFNDTMDTGESSAYCSILMAPPSQSSFGWMYSCDVLLSVKNIGLGNMKEAIYCWKCCEEDNKDYDSFPIESLCAGDKAGITINFEIFGGEELEPNTKLEGILCLKYKDLLENDYEQEIKFNFEIQDPEQCFNCSPLLLKGYSVSKATQI